LRSPPYTSSRINLHEGVDPALSQQPKELPSVILCYGSKVHLTCFPGEYLVTGLLAALLLWQVVKKFREKM
jgi:hypothetical protein